MENITEIRKKIHELQKLLREYELLNAKIKANEKYAVEHNFDGDKTIIDNMKRRLVTLYVKLKNGVNL